jgi:DNA-binding beta-propeller fold protein YncE
MFGCFRATDTFSLALKEITALLAMEILNGGTTMQNLMRCLATLLLLFSCSPAWAIPWAVVANSGLNDPADPAAINEAIFTLDLGTIPPTVHGPFLEGQLVAADPVTGEPLYGGNLFDVAYIPGTNDALVSNFGDGTVHRINFSNPTKPVLVGSVKLEINPPSTNPDYESMFAEDIAVTRDGKLALVSDGGFSPTLVFIDLEKMTVRSFFKLYEGVPFDPANPPDPLPWLYSAQAVAITPDDRTVIMADYFSGIAVYGKINAARDGLESVHGIHLCPNWDPVKEVCGAKDYMSRPVNVAISPDGKTALLADAGWGMVDVLKITAPGQVEPGTPFQLWGFPDTLAEYQAYLDDPADPGALGHCQSIVFAPDGQRAYLLQNGNYASKDDKDFGNMLQNQISWVRINGPGQASVGGVWVAMLHSRSSSQLFGVDTLAISKDGTNLYTANPTISGASKIVSRVNLQDFSTSAVYVNGTFPSGIEMLGHELYWPMFMPAISNAP